MNTMIQVNNDDLYEEIRADANETSFDDLELPASLEEPEENQLQGSQIPEGMIPDGVIPEEPMVPVSDQLSEYGEEQQQEHNNKKIGIMNTLDWALSPVMALGDAAAAPLAHEYKNEGFIGKTGEAFKVSGKAFLSRAFPEYGQEHDDYGRIIVDKHFGGLPDITKPMLATSINLVTDPTNVFGIGAAKIVQKGIQAKKFQAMGKETPTNSGIFREGVDRFFGLDAAYAKDELSAIGKLADKADRGDAKALDELSAIVESKEMKEEAIKRENGVIAEEVKHFEKVFGKESDPIAMFDKAKLKKQLLDSGDLTTEELGGGIVPNLTKTQTNDDVNAFVATIAEAIEPTMTKARGKTTVDAVMDKAVTKSISSLLGRKVKNFGTVEGTAIRMALVATGNTAQGLMARAKITGRDIDIAAAKKAIALNAAVQAKAIGVKSEFGRGLRMQKEVVGTTREMYAEVRAVVGASGSDDEFYKLLEEVNVSNLTPGQFQKVMDKGQRSWARRGYDGFYEAYVNSILSGPLTHATNVVSTAAMVTLRPTEQYLRGMAAGARMDFVQSRSNFKQANAMISGMVSGISDVFRVATKRANKSEIGYPEELDRMHELAKQKVQPKFTAQNLGVTGPMGKIVDWAGGVIRFPGNALLKEDKAFKHINVRMSYNQDAILKAMDGGKNAADTQAIYRAMRNNPDESVVRRAIDNANLYTFTNKLGTTGQNFEKMTRVPGLNLFVPFFRTPANILKFGVKNSVIGNIKHDLPHIFAKGAKGDVHRAKFAMGTIIPASIALSLGDNLSGAVDTSTAKGRLQAEYGAPPYSIKIGKTWVSYEKLEPIRSILGLVANYYQAANMLDQDDPEDVGILNQIASVTVQPFIQTIQDNAMLDTMGTLHYLIDGVASGDVGYCVKQIEKMTVAAAVPNAIGQLTNQEMDTKYRMAETWVEQAKKRIWGLSKEMPIRPNAFGEAQYYPSGQLAPLVNPFLQRPDKNDRIANAMMDSDVDIPNTTPKEFSFNTIPIKLNIEQRSRMGVMVGKGIKKGNKEGLPYLPPMKEVLRNIISNPMFKNLPPEIQKRNIEYQYKIRVKQVKNILMATDRGLSEMHREGVRAKTERLQQRGQ